ncbi:MarR family winged helix-turn-helix transcriptional regulator [Rhodococcoides yunnanense]|uniref:MarR family winged helix-turn-helix transcriptional regulator n=1 Tax=Rhodococcoides yunnanense TaxID=278209 RepID=UPI000932EB4D|nr:MarR family transcriptional regulator [Rhodococcus yunnanensis]
MTAAREWPEESSAATESSDSMEAVVALLRLADTVRAGLEESLDGLGLSWARYEVLEVLSEHSTMTYGQLGRHLVRHRTSIGVTVCAMEKSGLVVRTPNPRKPQQYVVTLTAPGSTILERAQRMLSRDAARRIEAGAILDALDVVRHHILATPTTPHLRSATLSTPREIHHD